MRLLAVMALLFTTSLASAYENRCSTRSNSFVAAKCPGKTLPADRLRNFYHRSHQIECTASADPYMRLPQKFDFVAWNDKRETGRKDEAFEMRRELPLIQWQGRIPYETVEVWKWEECVLGTSASECGTRRVCETVSRRECDSNGKNCRTVREKVCHDEPKTCYYDETRSEAMHCTNEAMNYTAEYVRPPVSEWNQQTHPYAEFLPNKYDLMPGEVEVVQAYNNNSRDPVMNPYLVVGDAWNKYDLKDVRGDAVGAACIPNRTYSFHAKINTIERDTAKASPNAFRLPVDETGRPIDPIGNWFGDSKVRKGQPTSIILDDTSAAVVKALADHSKDGALVIAKAEGGKIVNKDGLSSTEAVKQGFYKNTVVRVQLVKKNKLWFDRKLGWNIYNDDVKSVTASINAYSKEQEIMLSDKWEVDLMRSNTKHTGQGKKADVYWGDQFGLQADRVYAFRVSMYQRGVPFYQQDCQTSPRFACNWPWPIGRSENSYFSKPMEVRFETNKQWTYAPWSTFFYNGGVGVSNLLRSVFEPLVAERTRGENRD